MFPLLDFCYWSYCNIVGMLLFSYTAVTYFISFERKLYGFVLFCNQGNVTLQIRMFFTIKVQRRQCWFKSKSICHNKCLPLYIETNKIESFSKLTSHSVTS